MKTNLHTIERLRTCTMCGLVLPSFTARRDHALLVHSVHALPLPCAKCHTVVIKIENCGYSSFNVGSAKCSNPKCKQGIESMTCDDSKRGDEQLIAAWNKLQKETEKEARTTVANFNVVPADHPVNSHTCHLKSVIDHLAVIRRENVESLKITITTVRKS